MSDQLPNLDHLDLRPLAGSERPPVDQPDTSLEPLDPAVRIELTLVLRRRAELPDTTGADPLPREEFAASYGADPADVELVKSTLTDLGVDIVSADQAARLMHVAGSVRALGLVFGTSVQRATTRQADGKSVSSRRRAGGLSVPAALDGVVTAVLGLDDRPQARTLLRVAAPGSVTKSYTPLQLASIYSFPPQTDGSGQTIAIIELGGGFDRADLDTYFGGLGITGPTVTAVGVDGAANNPGQDPQGADGEVLLDIEVAGALAPSAAIIVYFAPNTDAGFLDAVSQAAHANPVPTALSISWGQSEDAWTGQARTALDQAFADAAALGVTVTAAAGDDGSADRATDGKVHVDFPASSPHALACGGTHLDADATSGAVTTETVWNNGVGQGATGGGVSDVFALPTWQQSAGVPTASGSGGRGVPDVAADADPRTGYQVRVDGNDEVIGGTSAVSPLWAALVARLVQATGKKLGLLQPTLYAGVTAGQVASGFRDITQGDNGAYSAGPGWDPCTGLGVPDGVQLLQTIKSLRR
ncbi:MAG: S53 family peptidase [Nocardioidaceae bacterium]